MSNFKPLTHKPLLSISAVLATFFKEHEGKEAKFKLSSVTRGADKSYYFTHYEHTLLVSDLEFIGGALGEDKKGK